jgi:hypothetical protein
MVTPSEHLLEHLLEPLSVDLLEEKSEIASATRSGEPWEMRWDQQ